MRVITSSRDPSSGGVDAHEDVGGVWIHYREWGERSAVPVVVVHGIMGHNREWDVLSRALSHWYRVIAVDLPGHGESAWRDRYTAADFAETVAGLTRALGLARVHLIGHSLGGMAASICAARYPDLVDRLVVIDVGPDSLTGALSTQMSATISALGDASYGHAAEAVREWLIANPRARPALVRHYVQHCLVTRADGRLVWRFDAIGLAKLALDGVPQDAVWSAIDEIQAPTLLLRGEHSDVLSKATAAAMVARLPAGQLVHIPSGGHDLGVEQPYAVAAAVLRYLPP